MQIQAKRLERPPAAHQSPGKGSEGILYRFQREPGPANTPWFQTSSILNCERINCCWFITPSLRGFLTTVLEMNTLVTKGSAVGRTLKCCSTPSPSIILWLKVGYIICTLDSKTDRLSWVDLTSSGELLKEIGLFMVKGIWTMRGFRCCERDSPSPALKMEGPLWQRRWVASRSWEWPPADSWKRWGLHTYIHKEQHLADKNEYGSRFFPSVQRQEFSLHSTLMSALWYTEQRAQPHCARASDLQDWR